MLKIYIANLGKYNEGELVGEWLTLPTTDEELQELYVSIKAAHYDENGNFIPYYEENGVIYEEVAIHDYETDIAGLTINEYTDILQLNETAKELDSLDEYDRDILNAIIEIEGGSVSDALGYIDDTTFYPGYTLEEVARELVEEGVFGEAILQIPDHYIDYEAIARDLSMDNYYEVETGVICLN